MERRMIGVTKMHHIRNSAVRSLSGVKDTVEAMYARKSAWAGHVARMANERWSKRIVEWYPREVKRARG